MAPSYQDLRSQSRISSSSTNIQRRDEHPDRPCLPTKDQIQLSTSSLQQSQVYSETEKQSAVAKFKKELESNLLKHTYAPAVRNQSFPSSDTLHPQQPYSLQDFRPFKPLEDALPPQNEHESSLQLEKIHLQNNGNDQSNVQVLHANADYMPNQESSQSMVMVEVLRNNVREVGIDVGKDSYNSSYEVQAKRVVQSVPSLETHTDNPDNVGLTQNVHNDNIASSLLNENQVIDERFIVTVKNSDLKCSQTQNSKSPQKGVLRSLFNRLLFKDPENSVGSKSKPRKEDENHKKRLEIEKALLNISKPIQAPYAGVVPQQSCASFNYDHPVFSPISDSNSLQVTDPPSSQNSISTPTSSSMYFDEANMKMKSTSSQTNINIHPITSIVQRKDSNASLNMKGSNPSLAPIYRSSSGYITTSSISPQAVVEVAKALRARMQEQQKQKEERHRHSIGNSSIRYSNNNHAQDHNLSNGNGETTVDFNPSQFSTSSQTLSVKYPSQKSVSSMVSSLEATTSFMEDSPSNESQRSYGQKGSYLTGSSFNIHVNNASSDSRYGSNYHAYPEQNFSSLQDSRHVKYEDLSGEDRRFVSFSGTQQSEPLHSGDQISNPQKETTGIVYAELAFPNKKTKSFKVFQPTGPVESDASDIQEPINYSKLLFPPPTSSCTVTKYEEIHI